MPLKLEVESLDELPAALREHYMQNDAGMFEITLEDAQPLRNAFAKEKRFRRNAEGRVKELETQMQTRQPAAPLQKPESEMTPRERFLAQAEKRLVGLEGDARKAELAKLESEMEPLIAAEIAEIETKHRTEYESLEQSIRAATIGQSARRIAADLARDGSAPLLIPLVTARLGCEKRGDEWAVFVTDAEGKATAASVDMLKDELRASPGLAPVVRGVTESEAAAHARRVEAAISPPKTVGAS